MHEMTLYYNYYSIVSPLC